MTLYEYNKVQIYCKTILLTYTYENSHSEVLGFSIMFQENREDNFQKYQVLKKHIYSAILSLF